MFTNQIYSFLISLIMLHVLGCVVEFGICISVDLKHTFQQGPVYSIAV